MEFRISRALLGAVVVAATMSVPAATVHAQATFTFEGVLNYGYSPAQDGVSLSQGTGVRNVGDFQATDQTGGGNVFGSATNLGCNNTLGGKTCGFNGNATPTNMYSVLSAGTFTLNSGFFMRGPSSGATSLAVTGYNPGGIQIFSQVLALSSTLTQFTFNWTGVNNVIFTPTGQSVGSGYFLADDIAVNYATGTTTAPEPGSMALLGTGLIGLVPMMRRKLKR